MRMFVIMKGDEAMARHQCAKRGILINEIEVLPTEVRFQSPLLDRPKIVDWYCEDAGFAKLVQPGELLWYTVKE